MHDGYLIAATRASRYHTQTDAVRTAVDRAFQVCAVTLAEGAVQA